MRLTVLHVTVTNSKVKPTGKSAVQRAIYLLRRTMKQVTPGIILTKCCLNSPNMGLRNSQAQTIVRSCQPMRIGYRIQRSGKSLLTSRHNGLNPFRQSTPKHLLGDLTNGVHCTPLLRRRPLEPAEHSDYPCSCIEKLQ